MILNIKKVTLLLIMITLFQLTIPVYAESKPLISTSNTALFSISLSLLGNGGLGLIDKALLSWMFRPDFDLFNKNSENSDEIAASVNKEIITRDKLDKVLMQKKIALEAQGASFSGEQGRLLLKALEGQTLDEMIDQLVIIQLARKFDCEPTKAEVNNEFDEIVRQFGGLEQFNEALAQYNYTNAEIIEKIYFDLASSKVFDKVTSDIKVSAKDAENYYFANKIQFMDPVKIKARMIVIKFDNTPNKVGRNEQQAKNLAQDIIKQLDQGSDFTELAKKWSEDEISKNEGGLIKDLDGKAPYTVGTVMPPEFDEAVQKLKAGQHVEYPIKSPMNLYYIAKLESLTPARQLSFNEVKDKISEDLALVLKQEKFQKYFTQVRNNSSIIIYLK